MAYYGKRAQVAGVSTLAFIRQRLLEGVVAESLANIEARLEALMQQIQTASASAGGGRGGCDQRRKDGSPDRRFANNYQIPVMRYAMLRLTTSAGLNEEYMLSNVEAAEQFAASWQALRLAMKQGR